MKTAAPEAMGISSKDILNYVNHPEEYHLAAHDILIARGDSIVYEQYYIINSYLQLIISLPMSALCLLLADKPLPLISFCFPKSWT